jgi:hypothetical protein
VRRRAAARTREFGWEVFEHPTYVPYLPQEVFTFTLKGLLSGRRFKSDAEVKGAFKEWLNGPAAVVYGEGT